MYLKYDPFRKRSVGASINLTFALLRGHAKDIFSVILPIAGPAALIYFISIFFLQEEAQRILTGNRTFVSFDSFGIFGQVIFALFFYAIFTLFSQLGIYAWVRKAYEEDRAPRLIEVWRLVRRGILPLIGIAFILLIAGIITIAIISLLGFMQPLLIFLFFIPFFYLLVRISLFPVAIVMEGRSIDSLARSWRLVDQNWWATFGFFFLIGLITSILDKTVQLPITLLDGSISYLDYQVVDPANLEFTTEAWFLALTSLIAIIVALITTLISGVASAAWFGNLVDRKENVGIQRDIEASMQSEQSSEQEGEY
ncbi:DUF7847 domain-containing protein [Croceimicrobium hydrocarbonivorans]|uniref:DUF7847 domain-containing protein n=1 Tax=Croceimicrobium hydrocarbonivorans TaxID=2761580 RepID=A0A7H0VA15_9FLAO|nr:hypothetical protein [Croceimicrobium hydrocarbonivorans]QNR22563.1 hypothetical protein H4K34_09190 [Croceimicrobium hydrocarbonivorans]